MAVMNHLHTYKRQTKPKGTYKCTHPDCTHTVPSRQTIFGKRAECCRCRRAFVIDNDTLRRANVACQKCIGSTPPAHERIDMDLETIAERLQEKVSG